MLTRNTSAASAGILIAMAAAFGAAAYHGGRAAQAQVRPNDPSPTPDHYCQVNTLTICANCAATGGVFYCHPTIPAGYQWGSCVTDDGSYCYDRGNLSCNPKFSCMTNQQVGGKECDPGANICK